MATQDVPGGARARGATRTRTADRALAHETKQAFKTTELLAYIATVAAVVIAGASASGFGARDVWLYVTILTAGYMVSRGLAKCGTRDNYWDRDVD
jgi:hypothetical protein